MRTEKEIQEALEDYKLRAKIIIGDGGRCQHIVDTLRWVLGEN